MVSVFSVLHVHQLFEKFMDYFPGTVCRLESLPRGLGELNSL